MKARFHSPRPSTWLLATVSALLATSCHLSAQAQTAPTTTKADVERWHKELSNWGRWGADDQLGALHLITPQKRKAAAALVRDGVSVSLARDVETKAAPDNPEPFEHKMLGLGESGWLSDHFGVAYHGYAHTHMDSLCHVVRNGKLYNGFPVKESVSAGGATKLGIENVKGGILSRGVLLDIPRLKGVDYLEPGTAIYPSDLDAWEKKTGVKISSGDIVILRTGRWAAREKYGPWSINEKGAAGIHVSCVPWLRKRDIAMFGSDAATDVLPSGIEGLSHPVHMLLLNSLGVHILDNCDLEALGREAQARGRSTFLLTLAPLPVQGGTGSPLNPIATF